MATNSTVDEKRERRLWIGNLDARVNDYWYQLLKLLQKHGKIEKFDLLFHKTGVLAGQPRGYAFVTYSQPAEAERAKVMHNLLLGNKRIIVTWAHSIPTDVHEEPKKNDVHIPALAMKKNTKHTSDRQFQIQAIEAKLKMMESTSSQELEINKSVANEHSIIAMYQQNKSSVSGPSSTMGGNKRTAVHYRKKERDRRPYDRNKR